MPSSKLDQKSSGKSTKGSLGMPVRTKTAREGSPITIRQPAWSSFPTENAAAAKAWFTKEEHMNFEIWDGAVVRHGADWQELESWMGKVAGVAKTQLREYSQEAASQVVKSGSRWSSNGEKAKLATLAVKILGERVTTLWQDEAKNWMLAAMMVYTPRIIHNQKATLRKHKSIEKKQASEGTEDAEPTQAESTQAKPTQAESAQAEPIQVEKTIKPPTAKEKRRHLVTNSAPEKKTAGREPPAKIAKQTQQAQILQTPCPHPHIGQCNLLIEVKALSGAMETDDLVKWVGIGLSAIVLEERREQASENIRCGDLSFKLLKRILASEEKDTFAIEEEIENDLIWQDPYTGGADLQIESEKEFQNAVAVLYAFAGENEQRGPLRLFLQKRTKE